MNSKAALQSWLNRIITGDCIELMQHLPDGAFDMAFCDPPYNLQLPRPLLRPNRTVVDGMQGQAWDEFASLQAYDEFTVAWMTQVRRLLKDNGTIWVIGTYHNIYRVGKVLMDLGFWILNDVVWIKTNPMPNFRGTRFTNAQETLIWAVKDRRRKDYTFNYWQMKQINGGKQMRSDWYFPLCRGQERVMVDGGTKAHPTQKPERLVERVILASTNEGDLVLDPFCGVGTCPVVCRRLGRSFVGFEIDADYAELARERLAKARQHQAPSEGLRASP